MFARSHGLTRVSRDCIKILRVLVGLLLVHCDIYRYSGQNVQNASGGLADWS